MSCGCGCGNPSYPNQYGNYFNGVTPCSPHFPAVKANFVAPSLNAEVNVQVSDSSPLHVGMGIKIGSGFYQITDILSATVIKIMNGGAGVTAGTLIVAREPVVGCYQYPIRPVGIVMVNYDPSILGFAGDYETVISNGYAAATTNARFGYHGFRTVQIDIDLSGITASNPYLLGISLPIARDPNHDAAMVAFVTDGGPDLVAVSKFGVGAYADYIMVSKSGLSQFSNGTDRNVRLSGTYEAALA